MKAGELRSGVADWITILSLTMACVDTIQVGKQRIRGAVNDCIGIAQ